jgi:alpha-glucosidase
MADRAAQTGSVTKANQPTRRTDPTLPPAADRAARPWWRDAVIYQIYIRSFADADGNGVGDLAGICSRLPYLRDLSVDALWITPFYPSPMADGGYDVADYRAIDPRFGSLGDAEALIDAAHKHGLRLIIDLVPNHTSDQHPWFQEALAAEPGSPARDRFIFRRGRGPGGSVPPSDWLSVFGGSAWRRLPDGDWYLHLFAPEQPDLNWHNPEVRAEFADILRFWLDRGVDGFRIDVAHGLFKDRRLPDLGREHEEILEPSRRPNHPFWDRDEIHDVFRDWRRLVGAYPGDRMLVAEAWVASPWRLARYVRPGGVNTAFNFDFLKCPWDAARLRSVIDECIAAASAVGAPTTWVLSNHDVVRHVTRYGGGETGLRRARAAALLMLALPGGAYVYQGEELGLPEVEDLPDEVLQDPVWERSHHTRRGRDGSRVPMPWAGERPPFEFSPNGSAASWLPVPASWRGLTVAAQEAEPASTLELYRSALRLRRTNPALGDGTLRWLATPGDANDLLVFERPPNFVCAVNAGATPVAVPVYGTVLLSSRPLPSADDPVMKSGKSRVLPPDTAAWFAVSS